MYLILMEIKELEKQWKPNGKIGQPYVPFKSIEVKPDISKVDEKKEAELKKIKEFETKWKPSGSKTVQIKKDTLDTLKTNTVPILTEKPPTNPLTKSFPQAKVNSKPPTGEIKPKITKTPIKNCINKNIQNF